MMVDGAKSGPTTFEISFQCEKEGINDLPKSNNDSNNKILVNVASRDAWAQLARDNVLVGEFIHGKWK